MKKRFFVLFICLLLLPLTVFAEDSWKYNSEEYTLSYGDKEYTYLNLGPDDFIFSTEVKSTRITDAYDSSYTYVFEDSGCPDLISVYYSSYFNADAFVYATEKGEEYFQSLKNGEYTSYFITDGSEEYRADFDVFVAKGLESITQTVTMDVTDLRLYTCYDLIGIESSGLLGHLYGAIYIKGDEYLYVNYDALDNTYFDSFNNFSYRKGTVEAAVIPSEYFEAITDSIDNISFVYVSNIGASSLFSDLETITEKHHRPIFIVTSLIMGVAIPLAPFVLGIVFAQSKRALHPKRWYLLSASSLLWMLTSIGIMLLFLI